MCPKCAELQQHVAELEAALEGAIFLTDGEVDAIKAALNLSLQHAQLVLLLYRAGTRFLSAQAIDEGLPQHELGNAVRADPDFRTPTFAKTLVAKVRGKLGSPFIETLFGRGYRLSAAARQRVGKILKDAQ